MPIRSCLLLLLLLLLLLHLQPYLLVRVCSRLESTRLCSWVLKPPVLVHPSLRSHCWLPHHQRLESFQCCCYSMAIFSTILSTLSSSNTLLPTDSLLLLLRFVSYEQLVGILCPPKYSCPSFLEAYGKTAIWGLCLYIFMTRHRGQFTRTSTNSEDHNPSWDPLKAGANAPYGWIQRSW